MALRQMRISSEENPPGGDIHHPYKSDREVIYLSVCWLIFDKIHTDSKSSQGQRCGPSFFTAESLCIDGSRA